MVTIKDMEEIPGISTTTGFIEKKGKHKEKRCVFRRKVCEKKYPFQ